MLLTHLCVSDWPEGLSHISSLSKNLKIMTCYTCSSHTHTIFNCPETKLRPFSQPASSVHDEMCVRSCGWSVRRSSAVRCSQADSSLTGISGLRRQTETTRGRLVRSPFDPSRTSPGEVHEFLSGRTAAALRGCGKSLRLTGTMVQKLLWRLQMALTASLQPPSSSFRISERRYQILLLKMWRSRSWSGSFSQKSTKPNCCILPAESEKISWLYWPRVISPVWRSQWEESGMNISDWDIKIRVINDPKGSSEKANY